MLTNGLYSIGGYRLALNVRDANPINSDAWNDAQEIVMEIVREMLKSGSMYMYHHIKSEIEDMLDQAEGNPSEALDEAIDKDIDLLYIYNHGFYKKLQEEVELPERWKDED